MPWLWVQIHESEYAEYRQTKLRENEYKYTESNIYRLIDSPFKYYYVSKLIKGILSVTSNFPIYRHVLYTYVLY